MLLPPVAGEDGLYTMVMTHVILMRHCKLHIKYCNYNIDLVNVIQCSDYLFYPGTLCMTVSVTSQSMCNNFLGRMRKCINYVSL